MAHSPLVCVRLCARIIVIPGLIQPPLPAPFGYHRYDPNAHSNWLAVSCRLTHSVPLWIVTTCSSPFGRQRKNRVAFGVKTNRPRLNQRPCSDDTFFRRHHRPYGCFFFFVFLFLFFLLFPFDSWQQYFSVVGLLLSRASFIFQCPVVRLAHNAVLTLSPVFSSFLLQLLIHKYFYCYQKEK